MVTEGGSQKRAKSRGNGGHLSLKICPKSDARVNKVETLKALGNDPALLTEGRW